MKLMFVLVLHFNHSGATHRFKCLYTPGAQQTGHQRQLSDLTSLLIIYVKTTVHIDRCLPRWQILTHCDFPPDQRQTTVPIQWESTSICRLQIPAVPMKTATACKQQRVLDLLGFTPLIFWHEHFPGAVTCCWAAEVLMIP